MKKTLIAVWLCAAIVVLQAAKITTKAEADKSYSFAGIKTWAWDAKGAGDVYMARTSEDDPALVKRRVDPLILAAVARELGKRNITLATSGVPDVTLHYYVLVTVGTTRQMMGQFLPAVSAWGVPPFAPATQSLEIITRGAIVLDVMSPSLDRTVWRGIAETDLDETPDDAKRAEIVNDAVHELVKRIPLKD